MTHRFPIKEIARQSGLSTATIDRAINNRPSVSPQTKARVASAISELEGQEAQLSARGRRMFFDFLIEAPDRFTREVQQAVEQVLPRIGLAVCRPRFVMQEVMTEADALDALDRIAKRGSQGLCLKARDIPSIRKAVDRLTDLGIPVVTLVTDLTATKRIAYVGLDNVSAGRTAAYLTAQALGDSSGTVLTTKSNTLFLGEEERETAFRQLLNQTCPQLRIVSVDGGSGVGFDTSRLMHLAIQNLDHLRAVYSMGGGNHTILEVLDLHNLKPDIYVAHDLDKDNRSLIAARRLNFILHHDLRIDMNQVFQAFLHHQKLVVDPAPITMSHIQVLTPENVPRRDTRF